MKKGFLRYVLAGLVVSVGTAAAVNAGLNKAASKDGVQGNFQSVFQTSGPSLTDELRLTGYDCDSCSDHGCGSMGCGQGCGSGWGCSDDGDIQIGGWVQMGYHDGVTPAARARNDGGSFNNHPHRVNLHQGWLYAEKVADGSCGLDWGFRADVMYGVDASDTQSFGNPPGVFDNGGSWTRGAGYGWAMPQLYAELARGDFSLKLGHFYTLVGYEVVTAPDNFFYSHALTMFNSEPFTHTGALVTYSASDETTVYAGWTAGWDTGFSSVNSGSNFLGGFSTSVSDDVTLTYITTIGNFGARSANNGPNSGYSHSLVIDYKITEELNYVFQTDHVRWGWDDDIGINQYVFYKLSDKLATGTRFEWWKNDGDSQYAWTSGVNIRPMDNLVIRPELRYDFHLPGGGPVATTTFGVDAIITF